ncbi:MAG: hypothetical protein LBF95_04605 [Treponema sp.]|nr:hypothetical protein [Treponema sp.]
MKKIVFTVVLIMAGILSVSCVANKPASESPDPGEEFVTTFDMIHGIVSERYCHFNNKSIDPSALYDKYRALIGNSDDIVAFKLNMVQYFADLKNTHSGIFFEMYGAFCTAKLIGDRVFIDKIYKRDLYAGLHEKDEIIAIDDVPVLEWIAKKYEICFSLYHSFFDGHNSDQGLCELFSGQKKIFG